MEEKKKENISTLPPELFIGRHGTWPPEPRTIQKLKNVTPKEPVQLELPFEESI
jgi:hypothetical protein